MNGIYIYYLTIVFLRLIYHLFEHIIYKLFFTINYFIGNSALLIS